MLAFGKGASDNDLTFAAKMTERQFRAIAGRIREANYVDELRSTDRILKPKKSDACRENELLKWLKNAWNTEHILHASSSILHGASGAALQWTFPQAYYAAFAYTLAFFQVAGFTESSHAAIKRKFASLALSGTIPTTIGFAADGTKKAMSFENLSPHEREVSSLHLDPEDPESRDRQILQFLKSTREGELDQQRSKMSFKTKLGMSRKNLNEEHWAKVSGKLGPTGLLCLLYRKRIKANYRDIDTFSESGIDPTPVFDGLALAVDAIGKTFDSYIAAAIGLDNYLSYADGYLKHNQSDVLVGRVEVVSEILS